VTVDGLARQHAGQLAGEVVLAEDREHERAAGDGLDVGPFHELGDVVEQVRLGLVHVGARRQGGDPESHDGHGEAEEAGGPGGDSAAAFGASRGALRWAAGWGGFTRCDRNAPSPYGTRIEGRNTPVFGHARTRLES
jgi:hypothetical protein